PTAGTVNDLGSGGATGTAGTASNNAPAISHGAPAYSIPAGTSRIAGIVLPPNARSAGNNFGEIGNDRSISGRIFTDGNGDGAFNGSDAGVGSGAGGANNVPQTLTLTGNDLNGNPVSITTTTDASGAYSFSGLPVGNYRVLMPALPTGTTHGITSAGTLAGAPNGTPSAPGAAPASIANIAVAANQSTA
ncbi:MAG: SdrD B-like domain-containing protein, partial [Sphingopyxis sp.]|uniref:SdrD B-like domain-containing protein n=1 Tax=Sphingopyxis sp. TaxID=1908224 RepID=UPI004035E480